MQSLFDETGLPAISVENRLAHAETLFYIVSVSQTSEESKRVDLLEVLQNSLQQVGRLLKELESRRIEPQSVISADRERVADLQRRANQLE